MEISYSGYTSYRAFNYDTLPWTLHQPVVTCYKSGADYYLEAEPGYTQYRWSNGETSQSIKVSDTDKYWVFVPYGVGYVSSVQMVLSEIANSCSYYTSESAERLSFSVTIVPNPASDQAKIFFDLPVKIRRFLSKFLTCQAGKGSLFPTLFLCPGKNIIPVNLSQLEKGIYFLRFISGASVVTGKLIVQ